MVVKGKQHTSKTPCRKDFGIICCSEPYPTSQPLILVFMSHEISRG